MTLEILTADALSKVRHGFFTRHGGASSGVFAGLNCGQGSSDQAEVVQINRDRVASAMQVKTSHLQSVHQIHSAEVVTLTEPVDDKPKADAMVTATPGLALGILTADCQPVLFAETTAGVIGAAHAGWRGARDGVLEATIDAMCALGGDRAEIVAIIGPSISQAAYEVGPEFVEGFIDDDHETSRYFAKGNTDRAHFDMQAYSLQRLRNAGIKSAEWTRHCTYADEDRFFSYRRCVHNKDADYGRLISAISL